MNIANHSTQKNKPNVSVIMPVYGNEEYVNDAIDSILKQTYKDFEFIIVVESGNGETLNKIIEDKQGEDCRIKIIKNEKKIGIAASLNLAIMISVGEYIVRMDADDISMLNRIECQVDFMQKNLHIGVSGTEVTYIDKKGNEMSVRDNFPKCPEDIKAHLIFFCCLRHPSVIIRKQAIIQYKLLYDESYKAAEDYELWCRACKHINIANLDNVLLKYRWYENNATHINDDEGKKNVNKVIKRNLDEIGVNLQIKEIKEIAPTSANLNILNFFEITKLSRRVYEEINQNNDRLKIYDNLCLKRVIKKRFYWIEHPVRMIVAVAMRSCLELFEMDKKKFKKAHSTINYIELNGFKETLKRIIFELKNKIDMRRKI